MVPGSAGWPTWSEPRSCLACVVRDCHHREVPDAERSQAAAASPRNAGAWGLTFVALLLVSAGMASVPGGDDTVAVVRAFYLEHTSVVLAAQLIGLVAVIPLVLFFRGLARSSLVSASRERSIWVCGVAVAAAAVVTAAPALWLCATADTATASVVHGWAVASDLVDVLLFLAIAAFGAACARSLQGGAWVRWMSLVVAAACLARAVGILIGSALLEVVAPVGFIVLVCALSVLLLRRIVCALL